jgi:hypothetical protein
LPAEGCLPALTLRAKIRADFRDDPIRRSLGTRDPQEQTMLLRNRPHRELIEQRAIKRLAIGAQSVGAFAVGAMAMGALAVGAIAIGRLAIGQARIRRLEIDELVVGKLTVKDRFQSPEESRSPA